VIIGDYFPFIFDSMYSYKYKKGTFNYKTTDQGFQNGVKYRALEIVLKNPLKYEKIFDEVSENLTPKEKEKNISPIQWNGTETQLVELIKALIQNRSITGGTQKEIFERLSKFLNIEIQEPSKTINKIMNRNNGSETIFLDKLKTTLIEYFKK
jgi:hypothetical protein